MKTRVLALCALAMLAPASALRAAALAPTTSPAGEPAFGVFLGDGQESISNGVPTAVQQSGEVNGPVKDLQAEAEKKLVRKKKFIHRGQLVAAPLPIVSPAIGAGLIPAVGYIFPFSADDKVSPPSVIGAAGLITNNGSSGFGIGANLYMKENTYEVTSLYAHGNLDYNLYGVGFAAGNAGFKVPLDQAGQIFFAEALRRIKWQIFIGPRLWTGDSVVTLRPSTQPEPAPPPDLWAAYNIALIGLPRKPRYPEKSFLSHERNVPPVHFGFLR